MNSLRGKAYIGLWGIVCGGNMKLKELKDVFSKLNADVSPSSSRLENQYPAKPMDRYTEQTYMKYENLTDVFPRDGKRMESLIKKYLNEHPHKKIVALAILNSKGQKIQPIILEEPDSLYYGEYELFACALCLEGFVEVFHNIKR